MKNGTKQHESGHKMSSSLSSGMAVDDLPEVTEPPRDGMSIHEVKQNKLLGGVGCF